jgi:hypothetical protein
MVNNELCYNAAKNFLLGFYIFKGQWIMDDYIILCKACTCMTMQTKAWMTSFLFKEILSFFAKLVPSEISQFNQHFLILNGHGSHVILEAIA